MSIKNISALSVMFVIVALFTVIGPVSIKVSSAADPKTWVTRCDKNDQGNVTHCEMFHRLITKDTKQRVAEFAIGYAAGESVAKGVIILPLGITLQEKLVVLVDGKAVFSAKYSHCLESGCYAFVNLSDDILVKFKKGNEVVFKFKAVNGKYMAVKMSLAGFTKALKEIS